MPEFIRFTLLTMRSNPLKTMKTKSILLSLAALATGVCAFAQENDDMYFSSKDRAKINLKSREEVVLASARSNGTAQNINPSDSYSARNENPDYVAGAKVGSNVASTQSYFNPNYQPNVNQSLYGNNCNCNNSYAYNGGRYGSPYGYGYSPYSSMGMGYGYSPFGYGSSFGMGYGLGYYGMGYGMSSMYSPFGYGFGYSPYSYGYNPFGYGYGGYGMGGYPTVVVVGNTSNPADLGPVYGRHPVRTSSASNTGYYTANGSTARGGSGFTGRTNSGSRMASNQSSYYNSAWKQSATNNRGSSWNTGSGSRSSFWGNNGSTNTNWGNSNNTRQATWSQPSNNWGNGGMRTSGFSGGSVGGGGGGGHVGGGGHGRR